MTKTDYDTHPDDVYSKYLLSVREDLQNVYYLSLRKSLVPMNLFLDPVHDPP